MSVGCNVYLVKQTAPGLEYYRAFETLSQAKKYVERRLSEEKLFDLGNPNTERHVAGACWEIEKIRLGPYEDGS